MNLKRFSFVVATVLIILTACNPYKIEIPHWPYEDEDWVEGGETNPDVESSVVYPEGGEKVPTLQTKGDWTSTVIEEGITRHCFSKVDDISGANQNVNVLEIDLDNTKRRILFNYNSADSTSSVAKRMNAMAAINGTYEKDAVYVRVNGFNHQEVSLESDHLRFWKHNGALVGNGERKLGLVNGAGDYPMHSPEAGLAAIALYKSLPERNILAGAPMLIDDYKTVGVDFVPDFYTTSQLNKLDYEDYRRHQGVRHPRTAVALTDDNDLLLIVADGRASKAAGMSAKELTLFLEKHFAPRWALNIDGGGSSTMYIKGYGDPVNDVVNYPTDNDRYDHYGQRSVTSHILVQ